MTNTLLPLCPILFRYARNKQAYFVYLHEQENFGPFRYEIYDYNSNFYGVSSCLEKSPKCNYRCSRLKGHKGNCIALGYDGTVLSIWGPYDKL